jgi:hypothetical protein
MPHDIFYSSNKHDEVIKNIIKKKIVRKWKIGKCKAHIIGKIFSKGKKS